MAKLSFNLPSEFDETKAEILWESHQFRLMLVPSVLHDGYRLVLENMSGTEEETLSGFHADKLRDALSPFTLERANLRARGK